MGTSPGDPQSAQGLRLDRSLFREPPVKLRPKIRWWWPGVVVDDHELVAELLEMFKCGLGGVEIVSVRFGLPPEGCPEGNPAWGADFWADRHRAVLNAAATATGGAGLNVDVTIGPAWPWASPAVSGEGIELSQHMLTHDECLVVGPSRFVGPPPRPSNSASAQLVAVIAGRPEYDAQQVKGQRLHIELGGSSTIPVASTVDADGSLRIAHGRVHLDPESIVDLTPLVDPNGDLCWEVPAGHWIMFGFWQQPSNLRAKSPLRSHDQPLVIDHMRREAAEAALKHLDANLLDTLGSARSALHEVFEDSLELYLPDTSALLWTPSFLDKFRQRRGYDLTPYLPLIVQTLGGSAAQRLGTTDSGSSPLARQYDFDFPDTTGERIRHDYYQTITDLWVEEHLLPTRRWARDRGLAFRSQVYGFPFDVIAAAKALDVPETEDLYANTLDFFKTVASGAHLSGARKVSMELGAVAEHDYMLTLSELKRRADKAFAAGINQVVLHGFPYKHAAGAGWPSWSPWSSEHLANGTTGFSECWNDANPLWPHLRPLADYLARAHAVLRAGQPVTDVAIYRDVFGYPARAMQRMLGLRLLLGGDPPEPTLNTALARVGFTFDFINPDTLADDASAQNGRLLVREPGYKALIVDLAASKRLGTVDSSHAMDAQVAQRLATFADAGLPIVFIGGLPDRGVSFHQLEQTDTQVKDATVSLRESPNVRMIKDETAIAAVLTELGVTPDLSFSHPTDIYSMHRRTPQGDYWFLWNSSTEHTRLIGSFAVAGRAPDAWDLWTGKVTPIGRFENADDRVAVPIDLAPLETIVIGFDQQPGLHVVSSDADEVLVKRDKLVLRTTRGGHATATLSDGNTVEASFGDLPKAVDLPEWTLHIQGATPNGVEHHDLTLTELTDWRTIPEIAHTSGTGIYRASITLSDSWAGPDRGAYLTLARVEGGIQVRVNGTLVSPASVPLARFDVGHLVRAGDNAIEIELTTTLRNRLSEMSTHVPGYQRFLHRPVKTQPYGLIGPVRLVPYAERVIATLANAVR